MSEMSFFTDAMKKAFHSITPPKNFGVTIVEHQAEGMAWFEVIADEKQFFRLFDTEKRHAVEYMVRVKKALEDNGAIVQLTRKAME